MSPNFAKAYYASTTTTASPPTHSSTSKYKDYREESSSYFSKPSVLTRSPKKANDWKDSYVEQLIDQSAKFKYASTAR